MDTKEFNSLYSVILNNLALLSSDFIPNTTFADSSSVARILDSLSGNVYKLKLSLLKDSSRNIFGYD